MYEQSPIRFRSHRFHPGTFADAVRRIHPDRASRHAQENRQAGLVAMAAWWQSVSDESVRVLYGWRSAPVPRGWDRV